MPYPGTSEYFRRIRVSLAAGRSPRQALDFAASQDPTWTPIDSIEDLPPMSRNVPELAPAPIPAGFGQVPDVMDPVPGVDDIINLPTVVGAGARIIMNPTELNEGEAVPSFFEYQPGIWTCGGRYYAI